MIKNQNIICISSIDWDFIWQGHQEIMAAFARSGNRVLFIENTGVRPPTLHDLPRLKKRIISWHRSIKGFRKEMDNLYVYSPVILPFPYSRIARWLNRFLLIAPLKRWMRAAGFYDPVIWTFLPTGTAMDIVDNIDNKALVYYCIADFYELAGSPKKVKKTEDELIKKSDLIFVQGDILAKRCRGLNGEVHIFPFGVRMEIFEKFHSSPDNTPDDIKNIKKPIIGYVGGVHRHIDFGLIRSMALNHPEWSIVLIGPVQTDVSDIKSLPNIFLLDKKDFASLPNYINEFNAAIVPYLINNYTETVFPTKLNEYHAMGKAAISTDLPEVVKFNAENNNLVLIGRTYAGFADCISRALDTDGQDARNQRISSARKNSWNVRIEQMSNLLESSLEAKAGIPLNWQKRFLKFYKTTHRNIARAGILALCVYFLVFYTPLIWFFAAPLKFAQPPEKANCIAVFSGGVGESGKAGQGYEERVQYGVELYKKGYADHLIFSSGYSYVFREPEIMKALAVSLGVPAEAIILEERAENTYENVKFTKDILESNSWNKALLVSSPYHMRRLLLVASKVAPKIKFVYSPIPQSRFYAHGTGPQGKRSWKQINLEQIKGIIHEYLGIVYYLLKGYISI